MGRKRTLTGGDRFGALTFVEYTESRRGANGGLHTFGLWQCDCGDTIERCNGDIARARGVRYCGAFCPLRESLRETLPTDAAFYHWLAGFIDGEGCFTINITNHRRPCLRFSLLLRLDDAEIVREIHARTGIGKLIGRPARYTSMAAGKPQIEWRTQRTLECKQLAAILDEYPLRAKKKRDYAIWRIALDDTLAHRLTSGVRKHKAPEVLAADNEYVLRMESYRDALQAGRRYDGEGSTLDEPQPQRLLRLVGG